MTSSKINRQNYNIWSSSYDDYPNPTVAIDELIMPEFYQDWSHENVLEIGCGTGRHTLRLYRQENKVVGIDVSEGMLAKAKEKLPGVEFIHCDFMEQDLQKFHFDKVFMSLVLEHISDLDVFFQKIVAILNDKGEVLISELHPERGKQDSLAHFKTSEGDEVKLSSKTHLEEEILSCAENAGLMLNFKKDIVGNEELASMNKKWGKYLGRPMIQIWSFSK